MAQGRKVCLDHKCRQTFETEELFDKGRVAQFVSVTGDANILHADPNDEGSEVQGEASAWLQPILSPRRHNCHHLSALAHRHVQTLPCANNGSVR